MAMFFNIRTYKFVNLIVKLKIKQLQLSLIWCREYLFNCAYSNNWKAVEISKPLKLCLFTKTISPKKTQHPIKLRKKTIKARKKQ